MQQPWMEYALCREVGGDMWFPERGDGHTEQTRAALRICGMCSVKQECLDFALRTNEKYGVWGQTTERKRQRMRAAQRR